jgi:hypothetical protein
MSYKESTVLKVQFQELNNEKEVLGVTAKY